MSLETRIKEMLDAIGVDYKTLAALAGKELSVPSYAGARTKQYDAKQAAYNWKQSNTRRFRNALRKAQFGTGPCHVAIIGDSSASGFIGGQSAAGYDPVGAWPITMRDVISRELGIPVGGTGVVPGGQWPLNDSNTLWPLGPRWVPSAPTSWSNQGGYSQSTGNSTYITFTSEVPGTQVDVWYFGTSGPFQVFIDGVLVGSPARSGAAELQRVTYSGLPNKVHAVGVMDSAADGLNAYLVGVQVSDPTKGLHVHNMSIFGAKATEFDTHVNLDLAAANRQAMLDTLGSDIVDCLMFSIGANDYNAGRTVDQIKTSFTNLRNKARYDQADVIIVAENVDPATQGAFLAAMYDLADTFDCPLIDTAALHGTPAQSLADGIITPLDNVHFNARGQKQAGLEVATPIIDMLETSPIERSGAQTQKMDIFDTPGTFTWTKPAWATTIEVICIGSGGGGGSGARVASGTAASGGAGGGGAALTQRTFRASDLGATESVTVPTGGAGGPSRTSDNSTGGNGSGGGVALFGVHVGARGGGGGGGGQIAAPAFGGSIGNGAFPGAGGANGNSGTGGNAGANSYGGAAGGGGGGGISTGAFGSTGGPGGLVTATGNLTSGGTGGATGVAGGNGPATVNGPGAAGGGGGSATTTGPGMNGGDGGKFGGAGGGGGSANNGFPSGAGGKGADGLVIVISRP